MRAKSPVVTGRAPRGARGLKFTAERDVAAYSVYSRAPRGARGLKFKGDVSVDDTDDGRAPRGARGLK